MADLPQPYDLTGRLDFTPLPPRQRHSPARVKSLPARLMLDRWVEHREAFEFVQRQMRRHGHAYGSRLLVNSLLHYRDDIIIPVEQNPALAEQTPYLISMLAFHPVPERLRQTPERVKHMSARLYVDRWLEHRQAAEFIQSQQDAHGDGLKTVVRALLHYRDSVAEKRLRPTAAETSLATPITYGQEGDQMTLGDFGGSND